MRKEGKNIIIRFDGSAVMDHDTKEMTSVSIGYHVYDDHGVITEGNKHIGSGLSSEKAEYHAMLEAIQAAADAVERVTGSVHIQGDAQGVVDCVNPHKRDTPSDPLCQRYVSEIRRILEQEFDDYKFTKIPRSGTVRADELASDAHPV